MAAMFAQMMTNQPQMPFMQLGGAPLPTQPSPAHSQKSEKSQKNVSEGPPVEEAAIEAIRASSVQAEVKKVVFIRMHFAYFGRSFVRRTFSHNFQENEKASEEESVPQKNVQTEDNEAQSSEQAPTGIVNRAAELIKKQMTEIDKEINRRVQNQNMKTVRGERRRVFGVALIVRFIKCLGFLVIGGSILMQSRDDFGAHLSRCVADVCSYEKISSTRKSFNV